MKSIKIVFIVLLFFFTVNELYAQFSNAEKIFLRARYKIVLNDDAFAGVRADGMPNTYGLPSVKDFVKKYKTVREKSTNSVTATFTDIGARTIYDLCSNGSPVNVWQDPSNPDYVHAVFVHSPPGDPSFTVRKSKYYLSTDRGYSWSFLADVPNVRSGYPSLDGFSDGTALIVNHSADGGGTTRAQAYKDLAPGIGSFTRLDAPGNDGYIWPRVISTKSLILTNKFVFIASHEIPYITRYNVNTDINFTPGTWLGWTTIISDQAETYALGRGTDGRIGLVYKNDDESNPSSYADVWFMESTNDGTSFSTPLKIFDANFSTDSLGMLRGISIVYRGNSPSVVFETVKQTQDGSFFPNSTANIRFWSNTLPGSDPNRSVVLADTNTVGFHPYIGVNDVMASICRPNIGVSANGNVLFVSFSVPSEELGGTVDTTVFMDIWLAASPNGGLNWPVLEKINPTSPRKDWRYVSMSKWNDVSGSNYYCNMVALRGHIPGSYVNGVENGESNEEFWSIRALVYIGPLPPPPPNLLTPANNSIYISQTPILDWSDISGATYNLQVSTNSGFTNNLVNLSGLTSSQYQIPNGLLQLNTTYYWHVSSSNSNGTGIYSESFNFTTLGVPNAPALLNPPNGSIGQILTPTLNWTEVTGAETYGMQVSTDIGFSTTVINLYGLTASQYQITSGVLQYGTLYYWRVNAENMYGIGSWSTPWNFSTQGSLIGPVLNSPANGSSILSFVPVLDWGDLSGATSYIVQVSLNNNFSSFVVNQSGLVSSSYQIPAGTLNGNTTYFWRARGVTEAGNGDWSAVWSFRVVSIPPQPVLVSPLNNATNQSPTPFMDWDSLAAANNYRLQISADSLFGAIVFDTTGIIPSRLQLRPNILGWNQKYYWRVNANNLAGTGPWSIVWNFNVHPNSVLLSSSEIPKEYKIFNNYPNPFNPTTKIRFDLPKSSEVKITVFDVTGKEASVLVNERLQAGTYQTQWNAAAFPSGVYFYRIQVRHSGSSTGDFSETKRMMLIK
ncbi:MAG: T9SS type A sorting domain-containing protein [Ignavibacteria bacterium]